MRVSITATLPAAPTLGTMSMSATKGGQVPRSLAVIDVPSGPACIDAVWEPLDRALDGGQPIALVPEESLLTPAPIIDAIRAGLRPNAPVDQRTSVVVSTSGSTGNPRGVCLSTSALTSLSRHVNELAGGDPTWVLAIPPTSIGGLNVLIRARVTGRRPIPVDSVGGAERFTDVGFAKAVANAKESGQPVAVSLVPVQLPRLLQTQVGRAALAQCSLVLVGGAALTPQAARDCTEAGISITTTYGMTETSGGCVLNGLPLPGVRVRLDGPEGRIFLAGPMLAHGYRDCVDDVFAEGWLRTQDRGRWIDDRLHILGRLDDVITVRGVNVDLVAVEDRANDHPAVDAAIAFAVADHDDLAIHIAFLGEPVEHRVIRDWIADSLGAPAAPKDSHRVTSFAMTSSNKIDRRRTAANLGFDLIDNHVIEEEL